MQLENGRQYLSQWKLEDLERFTKKLRPTDEIAVEVIGNTRLFHDAVKPHVRRVVAVDPNQFKVISHSVKMTHPKDARNLAQYLAKDLLPEVRIKDSASASGEFDANAGHAGEAADGIKQQDQQHSFGAWNQLAKEALSRRRDSGANLVLLDEPTNHLEIEAQQALEQVLPRHPGMLIVISHDCSFLQSINAERKSGACPAEISGEPYVLHLNWSRFQQADAT